MVPTQKQSKNQKQNCKQMPQQLIVQDSYNFPYPPTMVIFPSKTPGPESWSRFATKSNQLSLVTHPTSPKKNHFAPDKHKKVWFGLLVFNDIFSTNRLYRVMDVWNIYIVQGRGVGGTHRNIDKPNKRKIHRNTLFHLGFVEIISPR